MQDYDSDMLPISIHTLLAAGRIDCDLYTLDEARQPKLFLGKEHPFITDDLAALRQRGTRCLYFHRRDASQYRDLIRSRIVEEESILISKRIAIVRDTSRPAVEETWQQESIETVVWLASELAEQLAELIVDERTGFKDLLEVMTFDHSHYSHAANVASFAVAIAKAYGIGEREPLTQIALGALLHDAGKQLSANAARRNASHSGADKPDAKSHPAAGFKRLSPMANLSWGTLMMVYQHHEQPDGAGYPVGSHGDEIHEWARICAAANFLEKQRRLKQNAGSAGIAKLCAALAAKSGSLLDSQIAACLQSLLENCQPAEVA